MPSSFESRVDGTWYGWSGKTLVRLVNGSIWEQTEYHYQYRYKYRPRVMLVGDRMHVEGMTKGVRVRRLK